MNPIGDEPCNLRFIALRLNVSCRQITQSDCRLTVSHLSTQITAIPKDRAYTRISEKQHAIFLSQIGNHITIYLASKLIGMDNLNGLTTSVWFRVFRGNSNRMDSVPMMPSRLFGVQKDEPLTTRKGLLRSRQSRSFTDSHAD